MSPCPEILFRHPQACSMLHDGVLISCFLGSLHRDWLPEVLEACEKAAARHGGAVPALSIYSLDHRFPFDTEGVSFSELRAAATVARRTMTACSIVLEFDGLLGAICRTGLQTLGVLGTKPPMAAHRSVVEGLHWLEAFQEPVAQAAPRMRAHLVAVAELRALLNEQRVA